MPSLRPDSIPAPVRELCRSIEQAGFRAWVVGGCVRDLLMERAVSDWDLATSAEPAQVQRIFRRTIPTGIQHGTVTVLHKGQRYEVTTLRGESGYSDGRRPDEVRFVSDIEHDLARRDFTVNAIAYDPLTEHLVDPWSGQRDLEARLIRAVGDPRERFGEDGLRVLRAARFCATLPGFALEPATEAAIPGSLATFRKVSAERVHEEWRKALAASKPSPAFDAMRRTGILAISCEPLAGLDDSAFGRTMQRVDALADPSLRTEIGDRYRAPLFVLRMTALLRDVSPGVSLPQWADVWLRDLRCSNEERERIVHLLANRARPTLSSDADARRWLAAVGRDAAGELLAIDAADGTDVDADRRRVEEQAGAPVAIRELAINGGDVMRHLSIAPSRRVGAILEWALERVLEDPSLNERERLLALLAQAEEEVGAL